MKQLEQSMTLIEICKLVDKRHWNAMTRVMPKLLDTEGFGACTQIEYLAIKGSGARQVVQTYSLTKRQSLIVAAKLSSTFLVRVIDRWQELEDQLKSEFDYRSVTRECYKEMCDSLLMYRKELGKTTKSYHYSNEARMINRLVLYQDKIERDKVPNNILHVIDKLMTANIAMIKGGLSYKERKTVLSKSYSTDLYYVNVDQLIGE